MKRPVGTVAITLAIVMLVWLLLDDLGIWDTYGLFQDRSIDNMPKEKEQVTVNGRVYRIEQRQLSDNNQLWIYLDSVSIIQQEACVKQSNVSYHLICLITEQERPRLGSQLQVTGQFELFSKATNPGQFNMAKYYQTIGIGARIKDARILKISETYCVVREQLYLLQGYWRERLYRYFPEKEASILCAMLLGDKTLLDADIKQLYQQSGIVHILSISGLHITILGMGLYSILRKIGVPVIVSAAMGGILLILYGIMTGMGISATRAVGMYIIHIIGKILGRTYDMMTAMGILLIVMVIDNPFYLHHSGFLLSFGSVCGIGILLPVFSDQNTHPSKIGRHVDLAGSIKKALLPGFCITMFTLPIQLKFYYEVPVYSLFINLLVLPFVGVIAVTGLIVMMIPGGEYAALLDVFILNGYRWLCEKSLNLPMHSWNPGAPHIWQIICYYFILTAAVVLHRYGNKLKPACRKIYKLLIPVLLIGILEIRLPHNLLVTFLDVGQGDCIIVRTGEETYLFDCGSTTERSVGENILIPYLKYNGIRCLDGVFVSHADTDHVSGIMELFTKGRENGIVIKRLILPDIAEAMKAQEWESLLKAADRCFEHPVPVQYVGAGAGWQSDKVRFLCLHPRSDGTYRDSNAYSMCCLIRFGKFSMLLTGDVEGNAETELLSELKRQKVGNITVLKAAHHGSRYSTSKDLLLYLKPAAAIISCGKNNSYGHPHQELIERLQAVGCRVYSTPVTGAIEMQVKSGSLGLEFFSKDMDN